MTKVQKLRLKKLKMSGWASLGETTILFLLSLKRFTPRQSRLFINHHHVQLSSSFREILCSTNSTKILGSFGFGTLANKFTWKSTSSRCLLIALPTPSINIPGKRSCLHLISSHCNYLLLSSSIQHQALYEITWFTIRHVVTDCVPVVPVYHIDFRSTLRNIGVYIIFYQWCNVKIRDVHISSCLQQLFNRVNMTTIHSSHQRCFSFPSTWSVHISDCFNNESHSPICTMFRSTQHCCYAYRV